MEEKLFYLSCRGIPILGGKYKSIILYHLMTDGT